jgi:endonuclease/exonuclease/phosphatase family metal-dependent hydrolase
VRRLLDAIDELAGDAPVIIGGDLNAAPVARDGSEETLFAHAIGRGFEVHGGPANQMTTRPSGVSRKPQGTWKIDWFLTRGLLVEESRIAPAVAPDGEVLSDHDMVVAKIGGFRG